MECCIERNHLRDRRKHSLYRPDSKEMRRVVERSEIAADLNLLENILIDKSAGREVLASVHNPVSYSLNVIE